jgi:hypothetical protein
VKAWKVMGKKYFANKPSDYWGDFEGDLSVYYHFVWNEPDSMAYFLSNEKEFAERFIYIAQKYGIAVPINGIDYFIASNCSFYSLYEKGDKHFYPSDIFTNVEDEKPQRLISVDPLLSLSESELKSSSHGSIPFRVEIFKRTKEIKVLCYLDNDIFNKRLYNKKVYDLTKSTLSIDNSELAYLNTPRLNSYLRELKKLCAEFKMNVFEFEDLGLEDFSENGVLLGNEVIYYEDIVDILLPKHQIVK